MPGAWCVCAVNAFEWILVETWWEAWTTGNFLPAYYYSYTCLNFSTQTEKLNEKKMRCFNSVLLLVIIVFVELKHLLCRVVLFASLVLMFFLPISLVLWRAGKKKTKMGEWQEHKKHLNLVVLSLHCRVLKLCPPLIVCDFGDIFLFVLFLPPSRASVENFEYNFCKRHISHSFVVRFQVHSCELRWQTKQIPLWTSEEWDFQHSSGWFSKRNESKWNRSRRQKRHESGTIMRETIPSAVRRKH